MTVTSDRIDTADEIPQATTLEPASTGAPVPGPSESPRLPSPFLLYFAPGNKRAHLAFESVFPLDDGQGSLPYGCHFREWPLALRRDAKPRVAAEAVKDALQILAKHQKRIGEILAQVHAVVAEHVAECRLAGVSPRPDTATGLAQPHLNFAELAERMVRMRTASIAKKKLVDMAEGIGRRIKLSEYPTTFHAASVPRRFVAVLGPTNSGKTHKAFERLAQAESGVYLAPLRLLALEAHQRMTSEFGTPCSLLTGEESRVVEGARHLAATVEMLDTEHEVEVAVIDEVQMLGDFDRGAAWTQAVVGAPAREVWLLGSPSARKAITVLAERLGVPVEFHLLERKQPLACAPKPLARSPREALKKVEARDCLVVFSRRDALQLRDDLLSLGHSVACVYGALTPEVRESEADRFASGAADVLVATDAIAMGLNLPIDRIIFTAVQKYDGTGRDDLPIALTQQIAGRAGRFGFTRSGVAAGITQDEHQLLAHHLAMKTPEVDSTQFSVAPTIKHLQEIAAVSGEERLASLLAMFVQHVRGGGIFISKVSGEQLERARWLDDNTRLPLDAKYTFSLAPMNTREPEMLAVWQDWVRNVETQGSAMVDYWKDDPLAASLAHGEFVTRMLAAYRWFARRFPALFVDAELAEQMVGPWSEAVERLLRSSIRQGGGFSGSAPRGMPGWYWRYRSGEEPEGNRGGARRSRKRDDDDD